MHSKTVRLLHLIEMMERRKIGSLRLLLIFPFLAFLTLCVPNISFAADSFYQSSCFNKGSFTNGSTYQANLDSLFSHLSSTTRIYYGFCNTYFGKKPDLVTAIGLCRGDQSQDTCRSCLKQTMYELEQSCPTSLEAVGWSEFCMLHYANQAIYGKLTTGPHLGLPFGDKSNGDEFNTRLNSLLNNLVNLAAAGGPLMKYAVDNATGINAIEQCSPDLSQQDCSDCLTTAIGKIPDLCNGMTGCRIVTPSCNLRYQTDPISKVSSSSLPPSDIPPPSSLPSASLGEGNTKNRTTIIIAIGTGVSVLSILFLIYLKSRKSKPRKNVKEQHKNIYSYNKIIQSQTHPEDEPLAFDIEEIRTATNNFSHEKKLGQGGFGPVYKGVLPNGQLVAVKRLASCSGQGESEFENEIALMANLQHPNLVKLLGHCLDLEGNERILIYEFVMNKSLDRFIFDPIKRAELDWATRYKIIEGIAQGLLYLHEESRHKIIHRDLKASNILLDKDMNPKIADFGLARLFPDDQTHVTMSRAPGTYGYMAPEYLNHRRCSVKSDVFSFGVLILEIMSGQRNIMFDGEHEVDIRSVVWRNWTDRTPLNIVDPNLMREGSTSNQMMRCIHIGLLCVQKIAQQRPETRRIVKMLKSHETLPIPSQPSILYADATESEIELS